MNPERFDRLVRRAYEGLPPEFLRRIENVVLQVEDRPSRKDLRAAGVPPGDTLLGLYVGTPLTERNPEFAGAMPDRIIIYKTPIEEECPTDPEVIRTIQETVIHEFGHYFGLTDEEMERIEGECC